MEIERGVEDLDFGASDLASRGGRLMAELMATAGELLLGDDVVFMAAEPDLAGAGGGGGGGSRGGGGASHGPHGGFEGIGASNAHISIPGATAGEGGEGQLPLGRKRAGGASRHARRAKARGFEGGGAEGSAPPPQQRPQLVSLVGDLPVLITHERTARAFEGFIPRLRGVRTLLGGSDDEDDGEEEDFEDNDDDDDDGDDEYEAGGAAEQGRDEEEGGAAGDGREGGEVHMHILPTTPPQGPPPSSGGIAAVAESAADQGGAGANKEDGVM